MTIYKEPWVWITESISSIVSQTYKNLQLIIVIDNPLFSRKRDLIRILDDSGIKYKIILNDINLGLVKSLNKAISLCDGTYIGRMDSDDIAMPNRFQREIKFMNDFDLDFVSSSIININQLGKRISDQEVSRNLLEKDINKIEKRQNIFWHPTWVMKKEVMLKLGGYRDVNSAEDYDFVVRSIEYGFKLGQLKTPTLKKRISENSISEKNGFIQLRNAEIISKNFRLRKKTNLEDLNKSISQKSINRFNNVKKSFFLRQSLSFSDRFKLLSNVIFSFEGRVFLKFVFIQKYYLKMNGYL